MLKIYKENKNIDEIISELQQKKTFQQRKILRQQILIFKDIKFYF